MPSIIQARAVIFVVAGEGKAGALRAVFDAGGREHRLPAARVRPGSGHVMWFVDSEAARDITPWLEQS
jgi:6-phosphogluconolactonase/glucosamine-6-phosphate isomerase/deaminase